MFLLPCFAALPSLLSHPVNAFIGVSTNSRLPRRAFCTAGNRHNRARIPSVLCSKEQRYVDDEQNQGYKWTPQTLSIALPALAGMMTDPLLSMVDTVFVGRLGRTDLAALGACTSIFHLAFHCFRATTLSTSSLVTGALVRDGEKKEDGPNSGSEQKEAALIAQTSLQQSILTGVLISSFLLKYGPQCLAAMGIPRDGRELFVSASTYLNHRAVAAPAVVMLAASEGTFRGHGDAVTPWKVSTFVALLNLILDPFCMFGSGLGMGIKGAAVATAFSQVCGAFLYAKYLSAGKLLGGSITMKRRSNQQRAALQRQKRSIAMAIFRANAAMMAKQGSLLVGWAYATARATRMGNAVVASHQLALSVWLIVALILEGAGVAGQVLMAREWEGLKLAKERDRAREDAGNGQCGLIHEKQRAVKSLSIYMMNVSIVQGLAGSIAIFFLRQLRPSVIFTQDHHIRAILFDVLPHVALQMVLVSCTLVAESLAIGAGRFKWLAGGTTISSILAMIKLRGAKDLNSIWGDVSAIFLLLPIKNSAT